MVRNIVEHDFDVVGLQENSIKMLPQLEELLGDDYATHSWGAISETSGTHTTIVYKAGKFTLLDKGRYFLTSNPAAPDLSWDTAVRRNTVWVKLQDKTTGDVFFYFSTHLDHKGVLARAEGARINVQKMQEIADGYPAIIVGDFNAYYAEKAMFNTFNAYLDDSRKVTQTAPVGRYYVCTVESCRYGRGTHRLCVLRSGECAFLRDDYRRLRERNYAFRSFTHFDYLHI